MNINKPLIQIVIENDINCIEINEAKNKNNNKSKNKTIHTLNFEIEENEIIENYPFDSYEEDINVEIGNNETKINGKNKLENIKIDTEPLPESESQIDLLNKKINKIKEKNKNEDVIDFDDDSEFVTLDKNEKIDNKIKNNKNIFHNSNKIDSNININKLVEQKNEIKNKTINKINKKEEKSETYPKKVNIINYS